MLSGKDYADVMERIKSGGISIADIKADRVPGLTLDEFERSALVVHLLDVARYSRRLSDAELGAFAACAERANADVAAFSARLQILGRAIVASLPPFVRRLVGG